jgi:predicted lipid-binding transport protein (Tim44 family)
MDALAHLRAALTVVALLGSLGMVTWRQSRAFEALGDLDRAQRQASVLEAERVDLHRTIQVMESRSQVVPRARDELGMHTPDATELVILPGEVVL